MQTNFSFKAITMSTLDMRTDILNWMDKVDDNFLSAVHAMMGTYIEKQEEAASNVSFDVVSGEARTASELTSLLDKEVEAARNGEFRTIEDFKKESAQWAQPTK